MEEEDDVQVIQDMNKSNAENEVSISDYVSIVS